LISNIFLRLIKSIIAPVMFGVLVRAFSNLGGLRESGRVAWKALVYFEVSTTIALLLGWSTVWALQPGVGVTLVASSLSVAPAGISAAVESAIPASIIDAMARGEVLQIVVFCFLFGAACNAVGRRAEPVVSFASAIAEAAFRYTRYVMYMAPFAVGAALASTVANSGAVALQGLAKFIASAWGAQALFLIVVIGGSLLIARVPVRRFAAYAREPFAVAFATTSSAAALPSTLESMERFGVPERILGLVAPLSLTLNPTGSTIHLAMATLFVAQAAQIHLSFEQQVLILLTLKLTSKGVAGIPRANFVILAGLFSTFGLPAEGLTLLLGVDALIDMVRTSVNVMGHCAAGPVIAKWEGCELTPSSQ
jgi:proton glutamate symport protein